MALLPQPKDGAPSNFEGHDGDLQLRNISGVGIFLFCKYGSKWYAIKSSDTALSTADEYSLEVKTMGSQVFETLSCQNLTINGALTHAGSAGDLSLQTGSIEAGDLAGNLKKIDIKVFNYTGGSNTDDEIHVKGHQDPGLLTFAGTQNEVHLTYTPHGSNDGQGTITAGFPTDVEIQGDLDVGGSINFNGTSSNTLDSVSMGTFTIQQTSQTAFVVGDDDLNPTTLTIDTTNDHIECTGLLRAIDAGGEKSIRIENSATIYNDLSTTGSASAPEFWINKGRSSVDTILTLPVDSSAPPTWGATIKTDGAQTKTKGWQIDYTGSADFRNTYSTQLVAETFISSLTQAYAGSMIVTKSIGELYSDFTCPNAGSAVVIKVKDLEGASNIPIFEEGDWVRLRQVSRDALNYPATTDFVMDDFDNNEGGMNIYDASPDVAQAAGWNGKYAMAKTVGSEDPKDFDHQTWGGDTVSGLNNPTADLRTSKLTEVTCFAFYYKDTAGADKSAVMDDPQQNWIVRVKVYGSGHPSSLNSENGCYYYKMRTNAGDAQTMLSDGDAGTKIIRWPVEFLSFISNSASDDLSNSTAGSGYEVSFNAGDGSLGGLSITDAWGTVNSYTDLSGSDEGAQAWVFNRASGSAGGAMATSTVIPAGEMVLDYGLRGNGFLEMSTIDGDQGINAPYYRVVKWDAATGPGTTNAQTVTTQMGQLKGLTGTSEFGLFAGTGSASTDKFLKLSNTEAKFNNVPLTMYENGAVRGMIDPSTPHIGIGDTASLTSLPAGSEKGFWVGQSDPGEYSMFVGNNASGGQKMVFDASNDTLTVHADLKMYDGPTETAKIITGANSYFALGTGTIMNGTVAGTGAGILLKRDTSTATDGIFFCGDIQGDYIYWDGSSFHVKGGIINDDNNSTVGGGVNWRGAWVSYTSYAINDAVTYGGGSWICETAHQNTNAPADNAEWGILSAASSDGSPGLNVSQVSAWKRTNSGTAPSDAPNTDRTYVFATGVAQPSADLGNDWNFNIDGAGTGTHLWRRVQNLSSSNATTTVAASAWGSPFLASEDGAAGSTGATGNASVNLIIYNKTNTTPLAPTITLTYTVATGAWSSTDAGNGWKTDPALCSAGSELYARVVNGSVSGAITSFDVAPADWGNHFVMAPSGVNNATEYIYKKSDNNIESTAPLNNATYTFANGSFNITDFGNGWKTTEAAAAAGNALLQFMHSRRVSIASPSATAVVATTDWEVAVKMTGDQGDQGDFGPPAGAECWVGWHGGGNGTNAPGAVGWDASEAAVKIQSNTSSQVGAAYRAFSIDDSYRFEITVEYRTQTPAETDGFHVKVYESDATLPAEFDGISDSLGAGNLVVGARAVTFLDDVGIATSYTRQTFIYTPTSTAVAASVVIIHEHQGKPVWVRPIIVREIAHRGSRTFYGTSTANSFPAVTDPAWAAVITGDGEIPAHRDTVTLSKAGEWSKTAWYNLYTGAWAYVAQTIDGTLIVHGSIGAHHLDVTDIELGGHIELLEGNSNTLLGKHFSENGSYNQRIGYYSGQENDASSNYNIQIGYGCSQYSKRSLYNVQIGYKAAHFLTRVSAYDANKYNVCIGYEAGQGQDSFANSNTGMVEIVIIGSRAGKYYGQYNPTTSTAHLSDNVLVGYYAGRVCSGSANVMIGKHTGYYFERGIQQSHSGQADVWVGANTFIGHQAGQAVRNGHHNTQVGQGAGIDHRGACNVFIGANSADDPPGAPSNTVEIDNAIAIGVDGYVSSGTDNNRKNVVLTDYAVCIGTHHTGQNFWSTTTDEVNSGYQHFHINTSNPVTKHGMGFGMASTVASGAHDMYHWVWAMRDPNSEWADDNEQHGFIVYGAAPSAKSWAVLRVDNSSGTNCGGLSVNTDNEVYVATSSDGRAKENIKDSASVLSKFKDLRFVDFNFKKEMSTDNTAPTECKYGVIAQEAQKLFPHIVRESVGKEDMVDRLKQADMWDEEYGGEKFLDISKSALHDVTSKALQELAIYVDKLEERIKVLEAKDK